MKRIWILSLILMFSLVSFSQDIKVNLKQKENKLEVMSKSQTNLVLKNTISNISFVKTTTKGGNFVTIVSPNLVKTFNTGNPDLPVISRLIEIPQGAEVEIRVVSYEEEIINLNDLGMTEKVIPAQPSISKSIDPIDAPFYYNEQAYTENQFSNNQIAVFEESGMMRATRFGRIEIRPLQYNAVTNQLKVLNNLVIEVSFKNSDLAKTIELKQKYASPYFDNMLSSYLLNYDNQVSKELIQNVPVELVIVSDRMFESTLQPFIEWKQLKGFNVTVAYTDVIGATTTAIKTYLQNLYTTPPAGHTAPSFILFVGDVAQIPAWAGNSGSHVTDLRYCEYTNDDVAEVYYGRFSASTTQQLQNQIDKTLLYEKYLMPNGDYLNESLLVAGDDASYEIVYGNGQVNYGTTYYFNSNNGIYAHAFLQPADNNAVSDSIIANVSDGLAIGNYSAHCSESGWGTPSFTTSDVPGLTNNEKYGLLIGNCCLSNAFDTGECFGESVLRAQNKGAIGYIGGSNSTYWDEDYWWACGFGTAVTNPNYDNFGTGAFDGSFHNLSHEINDLSKWYVTQGQMNQCGQLAVEASTSTRKEYYWEIYHLMGDPTLMNYLYKPDAITYSLSPAVILIGASSIDIATVPYATVAVHQNGTRIAVVMTDANGDATIDFSTAITGGDITLVITAQNYIPKIETITPISPNSPYVMLGSYTPNNGDYGQVINIDADFINVASGSYNASNVTAVLSTTDPYITIVDGNTTIGAVNAGDTISIADAFSFSIANNVPDQYQASFTVTITGQDAKYEWLSSMKITCNAPKFAITGFEVIEGAGSDNNGRLDPGEIGTLLFNVDNIGHAFASGVNFTLMGTENSTPYLNITNPVQNGDLAVGSDNIEFDVNVPADAPQGVTAELVLDVIKGVYNANDTVDFVIGQPSNITVGNGTIESTSYPLYNYYENNKTQMLYLASELTPGTIQQLSLFVAAATPSGYTFNNFTIKLMETSMTALASDYVATTSATTVFSNTALAIPDATGELVFDITDFNYSGTQNLLVEIVWGDNGGYCSYGDEFKVYCTATSSTSVVYGYADSETPPAYDGNSVNRPNMGFYFPAVIPGDTYDVTFTVNNNLNQPITNANVMLGSLTKATDSNGQCMFSVTTGNYNYTASATGYAAVSNSINVTSDSSVTVVLGATSIYTTDNLIKFYPNPTTSILNIELSNSEKGSLTLVDINGKVVLSQILDSKTTQVDLSNVAKGIYILNLNIDGEVLQNKIIVK